MADFEEDVRKLGALVGHPLRRSIEALASPETPEETFYLAGHLVSSMAHVLSDNVIDDMMATGSFPRGPFQLAFSMLRAWFASHPVDRYSYRSGIIRRSLPSAMILCSINDEIDLGAFLSDRSPFRPGGTLCFTASAAGELLVQAGRLASAAHMFAVAAQYSEQTDSTRFDSLRTLVELLPNRKLGRHQGDLINFLGEAATGAALVQDHRRAVELALLHFGLQGDTRPHERLVRAARDMNIAAYDGEAVLELDAKLIERGYFAIAAQLTHRMIVFGNRVQPAGQRFRVWRDLWESANLKIADRSVSERYVQPARLWWDARPVRAESILSHLFNDEGLLDADPSHVRGPGLGELRPLANPILNSPAFSIPSKTRFLRPPIPRAPAARERHSETRMPERRLNAWIDDPVPQAGRVFHVSVNIGRPDQQGDIFAPFTEPDWGDVSSMALLVSISGPYCEVTPGGHQMELPRTGDSATVIFEVTAMRPGEHDLYLRLYLPKQMILLQSLGFRVTVEERKESVSA